MLRAVGFTDKDFLKPQIGIASTWSMVTPCNMHINGLADLAAAGADAAAEEQTEFYKQIAGERVLAMIEKANEKEPDTVSITGDNWGSLPTTLRWNVSGIVLGTTSENFTSG